MANQRPIKKSAKTAKPSFRPSVDPAGPIGVYDRQKTDYLTEAKVMKPDAGAKVSRNLERDQLLIFMLFCHGYRESEAIMVRHGEDRGKFLSRLSS